MTARIPISVFILTFNEQANLRDCLRSIVGRAGEVFLVDSYSTDSTLQIAAEYGVKVFPHQFSTFGAQRNWALDNLDFHFDWVFGLDADHRVTDELWDELERKLPSTSSEVSGYFVRRRQIFRDKWIRHGGYYPKYMLKIFRRQKARYDEEELDDRVYVTGRTLKIDHDIIEDNANESSIGFWTDKHNRYATQIAKEEIKIRNGEKTFSIEPKFFGNPNERSHWIKLRWYRLPLFVRPAIYFVYRYIFRLGFLDGHVGFIFHFLQAFWFRLLIDIKMEEILRERSLTPSK